MGLKLANTTFSTKADEALATIDAYTQSTSTVTNNATPDINDTINIGGFSGLKGGNLGEGLQIFSKVQSSGFKTNPDALLKGIVGSNSALSSALSSLSGGLKTDLLKGGGLSRITATVDGLKTSIAGADLSTLKGLGSLIKGVSTSNFPILFKDKAGLTNFATNIITQAAGVGIPNAFKAFADGLDDDSVMGGVMKRMLPDVITTSNINLLSNIATSKYGKNVNKLMPSFISDFSRGFTIPKGTKQKDYGGMLKSITGSYTLIDSKWDKYVSPAGQGMLSVSAVNDSSKDFNTLLKANANSTHVPINTTSPSTLNTSNGFDSLVKIKAIKDVLNASKERTESFGDIPKSNYTIVKPIETNPTTGLKANFPLVFTGSTTD